MTKVTVAVPIYNAAKHLDVMFDSLRHQTMDARDFEIICVNDCSTDNSKEIIEEYSKVIGNIMLINRAINSGGPVLPRNDSIAAAQGEYIHFLDNDDFLGEEALERLYNAAKENQSDVIYGRHIGVNGRNLPTIMFEKGNRLKADLIEDNLVHSLTPHKMFRLAFLKEHGFMFDPKANAGNDDQLFLMQCLVAAKVITVMADYSYYFVVARGTENLSANYVPAERWLYTWHRIMEFLDESVQDENYKRSIKVALLNRIFVRTRFRTFMLTQRTTREQKIEWLNETKRFIDKHTDEQLLQSLHPKRHSFWEAVKENDIDKLLKLQVKSKAPQHIRTATFVKTTRANVRSYKRPSSKALVATTYTASGEPILVHRSIKGWLEIRRVESDGVLCAEFIQKKDVRYTLEYVMRAFLKRTKLLLKTSHKKNSGGSKNNT